MLAPLVTVHRYELYLKKLKSCRHEHSHDWKIKLLMIYMTSTLDQIKSNVTSKRLSGYVCNPNRIRGRFYYHVSQCIHIVRRTYFALQTYDMQRKIEQNNPVATSDSVVMLCSASKWNVWLCTWLKEDILALTGYGNARRHRHSEYISGFDIQHSNTPRVTLLDLNLNNIHCLSWYSSHAQRPPRFWLAKNVKDRYLFQRLRHQRDVSHVWRH